MLPRQLREERMAGYVIWVVFRLKPGGFEPFHEAVLENAAASVRDEPGCRRFDVLVPKEARDRVALYEIYDDEAAFKAHLETPHFKAFSKIAEATVAGRELEDYELSSDR